MYFLLMNEFEFDDNKSLSNEAKHGICFIEAQKLWNDPEALLFEALSRDEERFLLIGKLQRKHWSAIFTYRSKKIRLISVRRSRKNEVAAYESQ